MIGAGRRVRGNFLPALAALGAPWSVASVTSRRPERARELAAVLGCDAADRLEDVRWDAIDAVVVSVTTTAVPEVLRSLAPHADGLRLVIDTPPVAAGGALLRVAPLLRRFRSVVVAEDFARFPAHDVLRAAVAAGAVGRPTRVLLDRTGFRYHGVALARSLVGYPPVRRFRSGRGADGRAAHLVLAGGVGVDVIGDYEPRSGVVVVEGTEGAIRAAAALEPDAPPGTVGAARGPTGSLLGVDLVVGDRRWELRPPELPSLRRSLPEADDFDLQKAVGTAAVLRQLRRPAPGYGAADGLYDATVSTLLRLLPALVDPGAAGARAGWATLRRQGAPSTERLLPGAA